MPRESEQSWPCTQTVRDSQISVALRSNLATGRSVRPGANSRTRYSFEPTKRSSLAAAVWSMASIMWRQRDTISKIFQPRRSTTSPTHTTLEERSPKREFASRPSKSGCEGARGGWAQPHS